MVRATNALYEYAYYDDILNFKFILLSESHIPLYNFSTLYKKLIFYHQDKEDKPNKQNKQDKVYDNRALINFHSSPGLLRRRLCDLWYYTDKYGTQKQTQQLYQFYSSSIDKTTEKSQNQSKSKSAQGLDWSKCPEFKKYSVATKKSGQWHILPRYFVKYVISIDFSKIFEYSFAPDGFYHSHVLFGYYKLFYDDSTVNFNLVSSCIFWQNGIRKKESKHGKSKSKSKRHMMIDASNWNQSIFDWDSDIYNKINMNGSHPITKYLIDKQTIDQCRHNKALFFRKVDKQTVYQDAQYLFEK